MKFDNSGDYREHEFDELVYMSPRKAHLETETVTHVFYYQRDGEEYSSLLTTIEKTWEVFPGTFSRDAPSDLDYYGWADLASWKTLYVHDLDDNEVDPEKVLTADELVKYYADIDKFVGE